MNVKDNIYKKRAIFWGLLLIIMIACFTLGMTAYFNGEGPDGKIRSTLLPITEKFNQLNDVSLYNLSGREFSAKYSNKKIIIKYETNNDKYKYKLKYDDENELLTLETTYDNEENLNTVIKALVNAIYVNKGYNAGIVFEKFTLDSFKYTTINDGISVVTDGKNYKIDINLGEDILKSGKEDIKQNDNENNQDDINDIENINNENSNEENELIDEQTQVDENQN